MALCVRSVRFCTSIGGPACVRTCRTGKLRGNSGDSDRSTKRLLYLPLRSGLHGLPGLSDQLLLTLRLGNSGRDTHRKATSTRCVPCPLSSAFTVHKRPTPSGLLLPAKHWPLTSFSKITDMTSRSTCMQKLLSVLAIHSCRDSFLLGHP